MPDQFGRYFEPFVGGGAVFFDLFGAGRVREATLGDSNGELTLTYEAVRDRVGDVVRLLREHADAHCEEHYYRVRAQAEAASARVAARMIYLNRTCYNGLYRVNKAGGFNTPMGRYANPTILDTETLHACSAALRVATIVKRDFEEVSAAAKKGDFAYFDPPYAPVSDTSNFTAFTKDGFTLADQERLAECARRLKKRGVHVLLSNADLPVVRKLYEGFEMQRVQARRNINSKSEKRGAVAELLVW